MYQDQHAIDTQLCCWWEIKCKKKRKEKKKIRQITARIIWNYMEEMKERRILPVTTAIPDIIEGEFLIFFLKLQLRSFVFSILNCLCSFFFFLKSERDDWDVKVLKMPLLNSCMICTFGNWYSWEISTYQRGKVFFFLEIGTDASVIKIKYRLLMRQLRMRIKIFLSWKEPRWWWNFFNVWAFNIHFVNSKVSMVYSMNYFFFFSHLQQTLGK